MLLIHKGEIIFEEAFGLADLETKRAFTIETQCRIASLTKPHTATMIARLVEQGKLSFDDRVSKFIPAFHKLSVVGEEHKVTGPTLAQCLSHTAGFASNNNLKAGTFSMNFDGTLQTVTEELATKELLKKPGRNYGYSRLGYMTAGRIAEIVTGQSYPDAMKTLLFDEIGAEASNFDRETMMERIPVPYQRTKTGFEIMTGQGLGNVINPGGNLITDLDGVARLFMLHRNKGKVDGRRVVSEAVLQKMYEGQPGTEKSGAGYGLGFRILQKRSDGTSSRIQHTGASGTIGMIDFDLDLIVIILTQVPQAQTNKWRQPLLKSIYAVFEK